MRLHLLSSAAVALTLIAAPQFAAAQSAMSASPESVRNPDAQTPATKAQSPMGSGLDTSNSVDASAQGSAAAILNAPPATALAATSASTDASATVSTSLVTNGPVADTAENRAKYGSPMSNAGKRTAAKGN